jgi:tetratricopeptide (TPR) repeat protein
MLASHPTHGSVAGKEGAEMRRTWLLTVAAMVAAPCYAQSSQHAMHADMAAPKTPMLLEGYGSGGFKITTANPMAQAYFDNGMQLAHAFAHKAAIEAMTEAVRLDPQCAMCLWGEAWTSGPTINFGKSEDETAKLAEMADKAAELAKENGTERERAMIHAMQLRYKKGGGDKRGDLNFARAMAALADRYPNDNEIAVISADAWLMAPADNAEEWKLNAGLAMPLLEAALKRNPNDTAAIHFYIHATEAAGVPEKAEPYADRLAGLAPKASHLVHMPSHTYYWVGRYEDAATANMRAVELGIDNAKRLGLPPPDGVWGLPYHAHNVTFGLGGALEAGDANIALKLGRPLVVRSQERKEAAPASQLIAANGYYALARFADPAEVLSLPKPKLPFLEAAWHYARGEAFARRNDVEGVRSEAAAIHGITGELSKDDGSLQAQTMTFIARNVLIGRTAMMEHRPKEAAIAFAQAAELQESDDFSSFSDPPAWHYPIRRDFASALMASNDLVAARREAEGALKYRPKDPGTVALLKTLGAVAAAR